MSKVFATRRRLQALASRMQIPEAKKHMTIETTLGFENGSEFCKISLEYISMELFVEGWLVSNKHPISESELHYFPPRVWNLISSDVTGV